MTRAGEVKMPSDHDEPTPSKVAIMKHPLHPMAVVFPTAFLLFMPLTDTAYWWSHDPFWALASFWLGAAGFALGLVAAALGMADFMLVKEVRRHLASWTHFVTAITALALAGTNVQLRWDDPLGTVLPWGMTVSLLTALMITIAAWLGGTLTFGHGVGTYVHEHDQQSRDRREAMQDQVKE